MKLGLRGPVVVALQSRPVRGAWIETRAINPWLAHGGSRPVRGAWIETTGSRSVSDYGGRRAPYGARGLKPHRGRTARRYGKSRPVRGAWIETLDPAISLGIMKLSRPVRGAWIETRAEAGTERHGARGLKHGEVPGAPPQPGRAPYGARGLKRGRDRHRVLPRRSRPVRGAWIETSQLLMRAGTPSGRAPYGARGLKRAVGHRAVAAPLVAPRTGRVD